MAACGAQQGCRKISAGIEFGSKPGCRACFGFRRSGGWGFRKFSSRSVDGRKGGRYGSDRSACGRIRGGQRAIFAAIASAEPQGGEILRRRELRGHSDTLVESELFGVEKGAFTGAVASRPGYFERAAGGTLFLDEIASLAYAAQGKLLRAIQERAIERVGGTRTLATDVRVIAASNVDLANEVREGRFRQDLYFRLCVFPIQIPPLRERRDDIPLLVDHFLRLFRERHRRNVIGLTRRAMDALLAYAFPGNIRELQNLIERGVIFADPGGFIDLQHMFTANEPCPVCSLR